MSQRALSPDELSQALVQGVVRNRHGQPAQASPRRIEQILSKASPQLQAEVLQPIADEIGRFVENRMASKRLQSAIRAATPKGCLVPASLVAVLDLIARALLEHLRTHPATPADQEAAAWALSRAWTGQHRGLVQDALACSLGIPPRLKTASRLAVHLGEPGLRELLRQQLLRADRLDGTNVSQDEILQLIRTVRPSGCDAAADLAEWKGRHDPANKDTPRCLKKAYSSLRETAVQALPRPASPTGPRAVVDRSCPQATEPAREDPILKTLRRELGTARQREEALSHVLRQERDLRASLAEEAASLQARLDEETSRRESAEVKVGDQDRRIIELAARCRDLSTALEAKDGLASLTEETLRARANEAAQRAARSLARALRDDLQEIDDLLRDPPKWINSQDAAHTYFIGLLERVNRTIHSVLKGDA